MTGDQFKVARLHLNLTKSKLARMIGYSRMQLYRWERNNEPIPLSVAFTVIAMLDGYRPNPATFARLSATNTRPF